MTGTFCAVVHLTRKSGSFDPLGLTALMETNECVR
jgi:hypothetical protein